MAGNVLIVLLWLFAVANVGMVYHRAMGLFHQADASMENWVSLAIASIFLIGIALVVYTVGYAGIAHLNSLIP